MLQLGFHKNPLKNQLNRDYADGNGNGKEK